MVVLQVLAGYALAVAVGGGARQIEAGFVRLGVPSVIARCARYACWGWAVLAALGATIPLAGTVTGLAPD